METPVDGRECSTTVTPLHSLTLSSSRRRQELHNDEAQTNSPPPSSSSSFSGSGFVVCDDRSAAPEKSQGSQVLKTGDSTVKLEAGQSRVVKAMPRTRVTTAEPSEAGDAGTVVGEVSDRMDGATMNVR
jgi:hypothetical protein